MSKKTNRQIDEEFIKYSLLAILISFSFSIVFYTFYGIFGMDFFIKSQNLLIDLCCCLSMTLIILSINYLLKYYIPKKEKK